MGKHERYALSFVAKEGGRSKSFEMSLCMYTSTENPVLVRLCVCSKLFFLRPSSSSAAAAAQRRRRRPTHTTHTCSHCQSVEQRERERGKEKRRERETKKRSDLWERGSPGDICKSIGGQDQGGPADKRHVDKIDKVAGKNKEGL